MADPETGANKNAMRNPRAGRLRRQISEAEPSASGAANFIWKTYNSYSGGKVFLVVLAFLNIISVWNIVIGFISIGECPVNRKIPIWMIVGAIGFISLSLLKAFKSKLEQMTEHINTIEIVLTILNVLMLLFGMFWVYQVHTKVQYDPVKGKHENYCSQLCYLSAFWVVSITWVTLLISFVILCGLVFTINDK